MRFFLIFVVYILFAISSLYSIFEVREVGSSNESAILNRYISEDFNLTFTLFSSEESKNHNLSVRLIDGDCEDNLTLSNFQDISFIKERNVTFDTDILKILTKEAKFQFLDRDDGNLTCSSKDINFKAILYIDGSDNFNEEGNLSYSASDIDFKFYLTNPIESNITFNYTTIEKNATADEDYVSVSNQELNLSNLDAVAKVELIEDRHYEGDEVFELNISNLSENVELKILNKSYIEGYIEDDDDIPILAFNEFYYSINEDSSSLKIDVNLTNSILEEDINFTIDIISNRDLTATKGRDFTLNYSDSLTKVFTIPAKNWGKVIEIDLIDDSIYELDENFTIELKEVTSNNAKIISTDFNKTEVEIVDNEEIPKINIVYPNPKYTIEGGDLEFDFNLTHCSAFDSNFTLEKNETYSSATFLVAKDDDYSIDKTIIEFPACEFDSNLTDTNQKLTISTYVDDYFELNETLMVNFNSNGALFFDNNLSEANITALIDDDDVEVIMSQTLISPLNYNEAQEGDINVSDEVEFEINVTNSSNYDMDSSYISINLGTEFEFIDSSVTMDSCDRSTLVKKYSHSGIFKKDETISIRVKLKTLTFGAGDIPYGDSGSLVDYISGFITSESYFDANFSDSGLNSKYSTDYAKDLTFPSKDIEDCLLGPIKQDANSTIRVGEKGVDLEIKKESNLTKNYLECRESVEYNLTITNNSINYDMKEALILDDMPDGLELVSISGDIKGNGTIDGYHYITLDIDKNSEKNITLVAKNRVPGIYPTNSAVIFAEYNLSFQEANITDDRDRVLYGEDNEILLKACDTVTTVSGYWFDSCDGGVNGWVRATDMGNRDVNIQTSIKNIDYFTSVKSKSDISYINFVGRSCYSAKVDRDSYIIVEDIFNSSDDTNQTLYDGNIDKFSFGSWIYPTDLSSEVTLLHRVGSYSLRLDESNFYFDLNSSLTLEFSHDIEDNSTGVGGGWRYFNLVYDSESDDEVKVYIDNSSGDLEALVENNSIVLDENLSLRDDLGYLYLFNSNSKDRGFVGYIDYPMFKFNEKWTLVNDNYEKYKNPPTTNIECRLCENLSGSNYEGLFDGNITGDVELIGERNLVSRDLTLPAQRVEIPENVDIIHSSLNWFGAIEGKKILKYKYSEEGGVLAPTYKIYKDINFSKSSSKITLDFDEINCSIIDPKNFNFSPESSAYVECNGTYIDEIDGNDPVCLGDWVEVEARDASMGLYTVKDTIYYSCWSDVTSFIDSNQDYLVKDIFSDSFAGWSLLTLFDNNSKEIRRVKLFGGLKNSFESNSSNVKISYPFRVDDFQTKASGDTNSSIHTVVIDGSSSKGGDTLSLNGNFISNSENPSDNIFNSTISKNGDLISSYTDIDIDSFKLENESEIGYLVNEANISIESFRAIEDETTADNIFPLSLAFITDIYSNLCYSEAIEIKNPADDDFYKFSDQDRDLDEYKPKVGSEILFEINTTERGYFIDYLALKSYINLNESNLTFGFSDSIDICFSESNGSCKEPTYHYGDSENNITYGVGYTRNSSEGGYLNLYSPNSESEYVKVKIKSYKNGDYFDLNHTQYRFRDSKLTTKKYLPICEDITKEKLIFEELSLTLVTAFNPSQADVDSNLSVKLDVNLTNNSFFDLDDANITLNFSNLLSDFGVTNILDILNQDANITDVNWSEPYLENNFTLIWIMDRNLSSKSTANFQLELNTTNLINRGYLYADSEANSKMLNESVKESTYLTTSELVAEYKFDECYWGSDREYSEVMSVIDSKDGDFNGTAYGEANSTDIESFKCRVADFDGVNDYISIGDNFNDIFGASNMEFTISTWIYPKNLTNSKTNHKTQNTFIAKASDGSNDNLEVGVNQNGKLHIYIDSSEKNTYTDIGSSNSIEVGKWSFIAISYRGDGYVSVKINDKIYHSSKWVSSGLNFLANSNGSPFTIGSTQNKDNYFNGYVDEFKIYFGALSSDNIEKLFESDRDEVRSCQSCYPKIYNFESDREGVCGDIEGEDVNLTLLNSDLTQFKFIAFDNESVDFKTIYPTLSSFDLNISSNLIDTNITILSGDLKDRDYTLATYVRVSESNLSFNFQNPCSNGTSICSSKESAEFNISNILEDRVVREYEVDSTEIDYELIDRDFYFGYLDGDSIFEDDLSYGDYSYRILDDLNLSYQFSMEFRDRYGILDLDSNESAIFFKLKSDGLDLDNNITPKELSVDELNITFSTYRDFLTLNRASIEIESSKNFCADGLYSVEVMTRPTKFIAQTLEDRFMEIGVNECLFSEKLHFQNTKEYNLSISVICADSICDNNFSNFFMQNSTSSYFTKFDIKESNSSNLVDYLTIDNLTNESYITKWNSSNEFTNLYFSEGNLTANIKDSSESVDGVFDFNISIGYWGGYDSSGVFNSNSNSENFDTTLYRCSEEISFEPPPDLCYNQVVKIKDSDDNYIDFDINSKEANLESTLKFEFNITNRGGYGDYLAIGSRVDRNFTFGVENSIDISESSDFNLFDYNITTPIGEDANSTDGGVILRGETSKPPFEIYVDIKEYKNGNYLEFNHSHYRFRDSQYEFVTQIPNCDENRSLKLEELNLTLVTAFNPTQVDVDSNESVTFALKLTNNSSFAVKDLNLTTNFQSVDTEYGIDIPILDILEQDSNSTPAGWLEPYVDGDYKLIWIMQSGKFLDAGETIEFSITIDTTPIRELGYLDANSEANSKMLNEPVVDFAYLTISELLLHYKFDECFWGGDREYSEVMRVIDSADGDFNATAFDMNSTDIESSKCRVADFTKDSSRDYIEIDREVLDGVRDFTISFWFKKSGSNYFDTIISGDQKYNFNSIRVYIQADTLKYQLSTSSLDLGDIGSDRVWKYITITRRSNIVTGYLDGVKLEEVFDNKIGTLFELVIVHYPLFLGQDDIVREEPSNEFNFESDRDLQSYLDEFKIHFGALSEDSVRKLFEHERDLDRSCPKCYPKFYKFSTDGVGLCGDVAGEELNLTLLNSNDIDDGFKFIDFNDEVVDFDRVYPTLSSFDLNISSNLIDTNITILSGDLKDSSYTLPTYIRVSDTNTTFNFQNPCSNGNDLCSDSSDVNFSIPNIFEDRVVREYEVLDDGNKISYSLVKVDYNFSYQSGEIIESKPSISSPSSYKHYLLDSLGESYSLSVTFRDSLNNILDINSSDEHSYYSKLVEDGESESKTEYSSLKDLVVKHTTADYMLTFNHLVIDINDSENFCAEGRYEATILTKPDYFDVDFDERDFMELNQSSCYFEDGVSFDYTKEHNFTITPICNSNECDNIIESFIMGNGSASYFADIGVFEKNTSTEDTSNIEINGSTENPHYTEWLDDGNFTRLYFENNRLIAPLDDRSSGKRELDFNISILYWGGHNKDKEYQYSDNIENFDTALYSCKAPIRFNKGPNHVELTHNSPTICGEKLTLTISAKDDMNNSVEWSKYWVEVVVNSNGVDYPFRVQGDETSDDLTIETDLPNLGNCCRKEPFRVEILSLKLYEDDISIDEDSILVADLTQNHSDTYYPNIIKDDSVIVFDCPDFRFDAFDSVNSCEMESFEHNLSSYDGNITTKIVDREFDLTLVAFWESNGSFLDFDINLTADILKSESDLNLTTSKRLPLLELNRNQTCGNWEDIKVEEAYRDLKLKIYQADNRTLNYDSSDNFSVKPKQLTLTLNQTYFAGEEIEFDIYAKDDSDDSAKEYNQTLLIDVNLSDSSKYQFCKSKDGDINLTQIIFRDGVSEQSINFEDIGEFNISIIDDNWTEVDRLKNQCELNSSSNSPNSKSLIGCNLEINKTIELIPYEVNLSVELNSRDWLCMGDIDYSYSKVKDVTVYNKSGDIAENFSSGCYAKSVQLNFLYNRYTEELNLTDENLTDSNLTQIILQNSMDNLKLNVTDLNNTIKKSYNKDLNNTEHILIIYENNFTNGVSTEAVHSFVVEKLVNRKIYPFNIFLSWIDSSFLDSGSYEDTKHNRYYNEHNKSTTFYSCRVLTQYFEACNPPSDIIIDVTLESQIVDEYGFWVLNSSDDYSKITSIYAYKNFEDKNDTSIMIDNKSERVYDIKFTDGEIELNIEYNSTKNSNIYPYSTRIYLNVDNYLWYEENNLSESIEPNSSNPYKQPSFEVLFCGDGGNDWGGAGKNEVGKTLPTELNENVWQGRRRLDW